MKIKRFLTAICVAVTLCVGCSAEESPRVGTLTEALSNDAWGVSQWISVVDAPIVTGTTSAAKKNEQKIYYVKESAFG